MFAAAMLYSTPSLEMSIYSTCKRISQKLLRNVCMFLSQIHDVMGTPEMEKIKFTQEEIEIKVTAHSFTLFHSRHSLE
jgi:hypothetical protein